MPNRFCYSPKNVSHKQVIIATFDLETRGLGGKVLAASYCTPDDKTEVIIGDNILDKLLTVLFTYPFSKQNPVVWYAHNAQYDLRYFIPYFLDLKTYHTKIDLRTDTDIFQVALTDKRNSKTILMRDSYALFPQSLKKFSSQFSTVKKGFIDFETTVFNPRNRQHLEYALTDAIALKQSLENYRQSVFEDFGVGVKATAASTAMNAWQNTIDKEYFANFENEKFIRQGYYGGLVFLTSIAPKTDCVTLDVNSCYPYCMRKFGVPYGKVCETNRFNGEPGFYDVIVESPSDLVIPILPARNEKNATRWYRGVFRTTVSSIELEFALEHGYKLLEVKSGLKYESMINPFVLFVDTCEKIRRENKGKPREVVAKLTQNSLYGKFGSKRIRSVIFIPKTDADKLGAIPFDESETYWTRQELQPLTVIPEWSAWITANARLHLLRAVYQIGIHNVIYGDTDSITGVKGIEKDLPISDNYGDFKIEKTWRHFRAIAPKVYAGQLSNGEWSGAAKGLPSRAFWRQLFECGQVECEYNSLQSLRVALKHGTVTEAKTLTRVSTDAAKTVNWEIDSENQTVRPRSAA